MSTPATHQESKPKAQLDWIVLQVPLGCERIGEQLKTLETARNAAANTLKSYLREAEIGTVGDRKIMWKQISKSTVDTKRLKTEKPEIYDSYLTTSSYRRFSIA